jgi:hypothetical protein
MSEARRPREESPNDRASRRMVRVDWARAYGGDAHHVECAVPAEPPPQYLDLPVGRGTRRYRLVRHPRTGRPARDPSGALVFVPAREES